MTCAIENCDLAVSARELCAKHYSRLRKYGDPLALSGVKGPHGESLGDRLSRIGWDVTSDGCWEARGFVAPDGYVMMRGDRRASRAHRVAFEAWVGPIPEALVVRHKCDNRACINPDHLELGTHQDNVDDCVQRGRTAAGERSGRARLTWVQVREIRALVGEVSQKALARRYGVAPTTIAQIVHNRTWLDRAEFERIEVLTGRTS